MVGEDLAGQSKSPKGMAFWDEDVSQLGVLIQSEGAHWSYVYIRFPLGDKSALNRNRTQGFASYQRDNELDYSQFHTPMKSESLIIHRQAIKPWL